MDEIAKRANCEVAEASPWFITGGGLNIPEWEQVKIDLQKTIRKKGTDNVPLVTFSFWHLVKDALLTDKVKVKEQLVEAEQSLEKIQEEEAFAYLGVPNLIKTDNGPAYASQGFQKFCKRWSIQHKTGIPYNPQDAERPMWLPEHCVCPVDVPADTKDHEDDPDSTNIGTGAMDVGKESPSTNSSRHS
ncbi:hypothetical protein STEG23_009821 [Scotinomys teguina]